MTLFAAAMPVLSMEGAIVLGLLVLAVIFFATELLPVDVITLVVLLVLIGAGILDADRAFAGFSSDIIIIIGSIFVLCGALQETGVVDAAGAALMKVAGKSELRLLITLMLLAAALSAFINNTTVTAMLVGPTVTLARRLKVAPSRVLLPMAYASILGGTCTLIGTSTNVAVSGYMAKAKMEPVGIFEIAPAGIVIVITGTIFLLLFGRYLLPNNKEVDFAESDAVRDYMTEILVKPESHLINQRMFRSDLSKMGFRILKVRRGEELFVPAYSSRFAEGDILLVSGPLESLVKVKSQEGIEIKPDWKLGDVKLPDEQTNIVEAVVTPQSTLVGRTLKESNFHRQYGLTVLGMMRRGRTLADKIGDIRIEVGDLMVVQGDRDTLQAMQNQRQLAVLSELPIATPRRNRGIYAVALFGGALVLNMLGLVDLAPAVLGAAVLAVIARCISIDRAYQVMDWRLLILIGGMTAFGTAVDTTGADEFLANAIVKLLQPVGIYAVLAGFFLLTVLLTQPMSNAAAALVVVPVAIEAARVMGVNERTFAIGIMLAASISLVTPFEPSCILVYGPGRYRFVDFLKTGGLLTLILSPILLFLLPRFWPLAK